MARKPKKMSKAAVKAAADRAEATAKGEDVEPTPTPLDPPVTAGKGRPTKYKPEFVDIARAMCKLGASDYELACEFGVDTTTIWRWQSKHEDFCNAVHGAKEIWDSRIERSLAQRAAGYTYNTEKVFCHQGEVIRAATVEHVPPDPGAAKNWLSNRKPEEWRDTSRTELTGKDGGPIELDGDRADMEIARRLAFLLLKGEKKPLITNDATS